MKYFVGIDWAEREHAFCVVDESGLVVASGPVDHSAAGLRELLDCLAQVAGLDDLPVAIERPDGLLVDTLVAGGLSVYPIHPNKMHACRSRYTAACGKSDRSDAYILADIMRTDGHRFRPLLPHSDELRALRALSRTRTDLVQQRVAATNRLRSLLLEFWPGSTGLFSELTAEISLAFLERYPSPEAAKRLGPKRIKQFLERNGYSGGTSATELHRRLRDAVQPLAGEAEMEAKGALVRFHVALLRSLKEHISAIEKRIKALMESLPLGQVMMSFPRAGIVNAAQIISEIGNRPERFWCARALAAEAGVSPVTAQSGKRKGKGQKHEQKKKAYFRTACNRRLRAALTGWADRSRQESAWAKRHYNRAKSRGLEHTHAVRVLARAWTLVLWRCLVDGVPYDPEQHGRGSAPPPAAAVA